MPIREDIPILRFIGVARVEIWRSKNDKINMIIKLIEENKKLNEIINEDSKYVIND